jgi:hypothetical protein
MLKLKMMIIATIDTDEKSKVINVVEELDVNSSTLYSIFDDDKIQGYRVC